MPIALIRAALRSFCVVLFVLMGVSPALAQGGDSKTEYLLAAGDGIRITVFQNPDLTTETRVSENGQISFPLLGSVRVGGITLKAAESLIAKQLRDGGFVLDPQVNLLLLQVRGNQVSVLGQVNRPGRYPIETVNTRVTDVLALAGGATNNGADAIVVTGTRDGKPFRKEIDIPSLLLDGKGSEDIVVAAGDLLYVHRAPVFYIYGEVQRPGSFRLERDMTVLQGLAQGGGLTVRGTERGLRIHRRNAAGVIEQLELPKDAAIKENDVLYVQESLF